MKYPKLWDGANAVGEAKVRALQQVDAPFLSASGPGFTAGKMGGFSEVKGTQGLRYLAWPSRDGSSVWNAYRRDGAVRKFARVVAEDGEGPSVTASAVRAVSALSAFAFRVPVPVGTTATATLYRISRFGKAASLLEFTATDNAAFRFVPASPVRKDGQWSWGFLRNVAGSGVGIVSRYARLVRSEEGEHSLSETVIRSNAPEYYFNGGNLWRLLPDRLRYLSIEIQRPTPPSDSPTGFSLTALDGDALGENWTASSESGLAALFQPLAGASSPYLSSTFIFEGIAAHVTRALHVVPIGTGDVLIFLRAVRDGVGVIAADIANTAAYSAGTGVATSGVTILRGPAGSASVVHRFQVANRALEAVDAAASGARVCCKVEDAFFNKFVANSFGATFYFNPNFGVSPTLILESADSGETWSHVSTGLTPDRIGALSVLKDGRFALPVRLTGDDFYTVFAFRDYASRKEVGRIPIEEAGTSRMGAVLHITDETGFPVRPMPGTPWVCDERITPPWEA